MIPSVGPAHFWVKLSVLKHTARFASLAVDLRFEFNYHNKTQMFHNFGLEPNWTLIKTRPNLELRDERGPARKGVTTLARTRSLSKQIRQAREVKGFTVAELADRLGVSQVSIYYWESGRVRPRDTNLAALCKALKMPMRETMALTGR